MWYDFLVVPKSASMIYWKRGPYFKNYVITLIYQDSPSGNPRLLRSSTKNDTSLPRKPNHRKQHQFLMIYPLVTNIAIENGPVEDVFPVENGDFPASHVRLLEGITTFGRFGLSFFLKQISRTCFPLPETDLWLKIVDQSVVSGVSAF